MQNQCGVAAGAYVCGEVSNGSRRVLAVHTLATFIFWTAILVFTAITRASAQSASSPPARAAELPLHAARTSALDLELGGDLAGQPRDAIRYVTREELLTLPQINFTVTNDVNFAGPTDISGVSLEELTRRLAGAPKSDVTAAISEDQYHAYYPPAYIAAHRPVLVLKINGQPPSAWPKDAEGHDRDMGPYMISHPNFTSSFKILTHSDEPQIPWGVVRLEFRDEASVFGSIAPRGTHAQDQQVQAGYRIAQQNCFRCHNMGAEGGKKAGHPWLVLSAWASAQPNYFAAYVHNPKERNSNAQMPSFPEYDDATIRALIAYFQTFTAREKP
jgi:mono/diheme cytochrome c family protein